MYLDRRVPPALVDAFAGDGPLAFLLDRVKTHPDLDLQFRHDPMKPADSKATIYYGGTRILEVLYSRNGIFRLDANKECRAAAPYSPSWDGGRTASQFTDERAAMESYLDSVIDTVHPGRWLQEGQVEARLVSSARAFAAIDRQTVFGFPSKPVREELFAMLCSRFEGYLRKAKKRSEADVLAIDGKARLLAIEVKHASAPDLVTSPAQACFDSTLVRLWRSETSRAAEILNGMLEQRIRVGLTPDPGVRLPKEFEIVPVAAVGPVDDASALPTGMFVERDRLLASPLAPDGLEIWRIGENGNAVTVVA